MDEATWLTCTEPTPMLEFVRGKASDRKLVLFACACQRRIWIFLSQEEQDSRQLKLLELIADGVIEHSQLPEHWRNDWNPQGLAAIFSRDAALSSARLGFVVASEEQKVQTVLLRDTFGPLPFRPITLNSAWLAWSDHTIPKLAQAIYDDRAFDRLPILADALEEAGCGNADILSHCRSSEGPHVRGCWVVDLVLGKS